MGLQSRIIAENQFNMEMVFNKYDNTIAKVLTLNV